MLARLESCPICKGSLAGCAECGSTGMVTDERSKLLSIKAVRPGLTAAPPGVLFLDENGLIPSVADDA